MDTENAKESVAAIADDSENPFAQMVETAKRELQSSDNIQARIAALEARVKKLEETGFLLPIAALRPCDK